MRSDKIQNLNKQFESPDDSHNYNESTHCFSSENNINASSPNEDEKEIDEEIMSNDDINSEKESEIVDTFAVKPIFFLPGVPST